jgi:hypothetical protein
VKLSMLAAVMAVALLEGTSAHAWQVAKEAGLQIAQQTPVPPVKDQQQVPATPPGTATTPGSAPSNEEAQEGADDFSMGDIPVVETVELTVDQAKRALDAYALVSEKYKDAELENYENLQDFVDQAPQGKAFEADIKAAGFVTVNEWNTAITTLSFALANLSDDQTADIRQQIDELKADTEMAQDMRERMIAALNAMIPSENNKKVIAELKAEPIYSEKLRQLETEEVE